MRAEDRALRLKRLKLRSVRRGIREMDLLLGAFAAARLDGLSDAELDGFESLLAENDHDLLAWITGQATTPGTHAALIALLAADATAHATSGGFGKL